MSFRSLFAITLVLALFLASALTQAIPLTGLQNSHDPATIVKDDDTYFHFTTGDGIWYSTSTNLTHWVGGPGPVFPVGTWPAWINAAVPGFSGHFWAPDVIRMGDHWYVYYSVSTFGSSRSAIGVVRTPSLKNPQWEDLGMVISSNSTLGSASQSTEFNAIDPALFRDDDGRVYMSYGSWFAGIALVEINPETGKRLNDEVAPQYLYGGGHQSIEAPYIIKHDDYYYLYVNRGTCCAGLNSTYYIQVGWSENITGPYEGWYTVLENFSEVKYKGPGHIGLLQEGNCSYVSTHYYDATANGAAKLDILSLSYNASGMPQLTRDFTPGNCAASSSSSSFTSSSVSSSSFSSSTISSNSSALSSIGASESSSASSVSSTDASSTSAATNSSLAASSTSTATGGSGSSGIYLLLCLLGLCLRFLTCVARR